MSAVSIARREGTGSMTDRRGGRRSLLARDELLSPAEAARYTGLKVRTIQYLATSGRLPFEVLTGASRPMRRFRKSELENIVVDGATGAGRGGSTGTRS